MINLLDCKKITDVAILEILSIAEKLRYINIVGTRITPLKGLMLYKHCKFEMPDLHIITRHLVKK